MEGKERGKTNTPITEDKEEDAAIDDEDGDVIPYEVSSRPIPFRCPCRVLIAGTTNCGNSFKCALLSHRNSLLSLLGKSTFVEKLCDDMKYWFNVRFHTVYYVYPKSNIVGGIREKHIRKLRQACERINVNFKTNTDPLEVFLASLEEGHITDRLVILDDLAVDIVNEKKPADAFMRVSHHYQVSFLYITQNFFLPGKYGPTITRQFTDFVLFLSQLNRKMQNMISEKLFHKNPRFLDECLKYLLNTYENCYDRYVLIDFNETSISNLPKNHIRTFGVRTHIFRNAKGKWKTEWLQPSIKK
jgi:hypothetical protein